MPFDWFRSPRVDPLKIGVGSVQFRFSSKVIGLESTLHLAVSESRGVSFSGRVSQAPEGLEGSGPELDPIAPPGAT
jgi:hypothetical protein